MKRRPTIIDVAFKAGVSKSTVSLVLQNSPSVKEETRKQVREAMAEIGYVYNRSAANMRKSNAGLVGLVINDLRNPFFSEFATSLQMALAASGYATVVANTDENAELQLQVVSSMIEHGVSALVICSAYDDMGRSFDAIARAGIPALQMLRCVDDRIEDFPFAAPDYKKGSRIATQHLVDTGARNIAFVGGIEGRAVAEERKQGYFEVLNENGMTPVVLPGRASRDFGRSAAKALLHDNPDVDAAICFNDLVALGLLHGCYEVGRKVGESFRIVGFDDIEEAAQSFPAITSVKCDIGAIGQATARTVIDWLEEGKKPSAETRSPVSLSVRASSAAESK
ncbi:LacI family DNA-binding transcriptional regulator [Falsihalocynthiibacter sp. SS001]|uniref:LacI family DNA-binding transcriptional regulator n=1 Tax=Falsihalocynthiibacter sp. SS001 TaxID=3349698 RepID=UPI0036D3BF83